MLDYKYLISSLSRKKKVLMVECYSWLISDFSEISKMWVITGGLLINLLSTVHYKVKCEMTMKMSSWWVSEKQVVDWVAYLI